MKKDLFKKNLAIGVIILFIVVGFQPAFAYNITIDKIEQQPLGETFMKTYGGKEYDVGYSVQQTTDGVYIITGETDSFGAGLFDVWLIKTDKDGKSRNKGFNKFAINFLQSHPSLFLLLQKLIQQQWFGLK